MNVVDDKGAEISACEVYGNAPFASCRYESTFRPTNGKTESVYMQRDWITVNIFTSNVVLRRTEMLKLKLKTMQIIIIAYRAFW